jgi:hypothetical protein
MNAMKNMEGGQLMLASLGLIVKKRIEFNNLEELCNLVQNIKRTFTHNYINSSRDVYLK